MRKIREILRLKWEAKLGNRQIAGSCRISSSTVAQYLYRAKLAGLSWPLPDSLDDGVLERMLFPPPAAFGKERPLPDWAHLHQELKKKGVTLALLWHEYKEVSPDGYQYSQFCELYRRFAKKVDLSMRQSHRAGEKLFVDWAGQTIPLVDAATGEIRKAHLFVAAFGASNYTYAEPTPSETLPDWIGAHTRAFSFFGGVPEILVPDNTKTAVRAPCRYEPDINPTYQEMARHYGCVVIPTRTRAPKDKAKVESAVQVAERWILAAIRNRTFFTIAELAREVSALVSRLNERPFRKLPGSRRSAFLELDHPALSPLPSEPYVYTEWRRARVGIDYHVEVDRHYYSVPHQLVKEEIDVALTAATVEMFYKTRRVAAHVRSYHKGRHTTIVGHMPRAHRDYAEWTPERLIRWASLAGPATKQAVETVIVSRPHHQQGFRSALGIIRLEKTWGAKRLEAASKRAIAIGGVSYKSIKSILSTGLDRRPLPETAELRLALDHENLRGKDYYCKGVANAYPSDH